MSECNRDLLLANVAIAVASGKFVVNPPGKSCNICGSHGTLVTSYGLLDCPVCQGSGTVPQNYLTRLSRKAKGQPTRIVTVEDKKP